MAPKSGCKICPSILNADLSNLAVEVRNLINVGADWIHCDVMDGHFVPNLTFGHPVIKSLRSAIGPHAFLDVHAMVEEPEIWVNPIADAGGSQYTFHIEAITGRDSAPNLDALVKSIRHVGMRAGVAIKPDTPVEQVLNVANKVDQVLVMTVEPGFGGQGFMADMMPKVRRLRSENPDLDIQVDGGINENNVAMAAEAGANVIVAGMSIVRSNNPGNTMTLMRNAVQAHLASATS